MSRGEKTFSIIIRGVFILAFGAFLAASIHHVAVFFQNFEPSTLDNSVSWGSYALAISVDGTALMLTIGMMFFSKGIARHAKIIVWIFIVCLTGFSWVVNWEYAVTYQTTTLTGNLDPHWKLINPILASSFAFLNLAYSVVSEFFGTKQKTTEELKMELDGLTGERAQLMKQIREAKGPDLIDRATEKALKAKKAAAQVLAKEEDTQPGVGNKTEVQPPTGELDKLDLTVAFLQQYPAATDEQIADYLGMKRPASARFWRLKAQEIATLNHAQKVEVKTERITSPLDDQGGSENGSNGVPAAEAKAEIFEEVSEEQYQELYDTEPITAAEPTTDPEVEAIDPKNNPDDGSATEQITSTLNILTRRKPLSIAEAAGVLGCSERYVRDLRKNGKLTAEDPEGKSIKAGSVRAYLANRKVRVS